MKIKVFKTSIGQDIVSEYHIKDDVMYWVYPMILMPTQGGKIGLVPFAPYTGDDISVNTDLFIFQHPADKQITDLYCAMAAKMREHKSGIITPTRKPLELI